MKLLEEKPWSKIGLRRELRSRGHDEDSMHAAIRHLTDVGLSWRHECLRRARQICREQPGISRTELRTALGGESFLPAEVEFAEKTLPVNWFDHARRAYADSAQLGVDPSAAQYTLESGDFTPSEIAYALTGVPESEEERALQRAEYFLGASPASQASVREELSDEFDQWAVQRVFEQLGDIWQEQALAAAWRLLGRYGVLLSQQRLQSFLRMQGFTLSQALHAAQELPVDWAEQALQCASLLHYRKGIPVSRLKEELRRQQFTGSEIRAALRQVSAE